jgi:Na+-driven multidrug efflux pump
MWAMLPVVTVRRLGLDASAFGILMGCIGGGAVAGAGLLPRLFTTDPAVLHEAAAAWPWFAAMQPVAGVVFALDGVLIGAGDARYMRNLTVVAALGGFLPAIWLTWWLRLGLGGIWAGLTLFVVIRLVALLARLRSGRWAVVGVVH